MSTSTPRVLKDEIQAAENRDHLILWFEEIGIQDIAKVGGKNASLGEMIRELSEGGVKVPNGFAITAQAYYFFIKEAGLEKKLKNIFDHLDTDDIYNLSHRGAQARSLLLHASFPPELEQQIVSAYRKLCEEYGPDTDCAVRSSATAEDLPDASFAGQQETYLNVHGEKNILEACKKCFASLFTDRAISYRQTRGFDHLAIGLSIGVQKMVRSDLACSGVMFSIDTETGFQNTVLISAAYGLGENIVQGTVNPDEYVVFKPTLGQAISRF
jgi:pyruvate, water dikinase